MLLFSIPYKVLSFVTIVDKEKLSDLQKKYGDFISFTIMGKRFVILNSYDINKECLIDNGEAFAGRFNSAAAKEMAKGCGRSSFHKLILLISKRGLFLNNKITPTITP